MIQSHIASMGNFQETEDNKLVSGIFMYYVLHLSVAWVCKLSCFPYVTKLFTGWCNDETQISFLLFLSNRNNFVFVLVNKFWLVKKFVKIQFLFIASDELLINDIWND